MGLYIKWNLANQIYKKEIKNKKTKIKSIIFLIKKTPDYKPPVPREEEKNIS